MSRWTTEELSILRNKWHEVGQRVLKSSLPRRSWQSIMRAAWEQGLPFGVPQGFDSFRETIKRTGYSRVALTKILRDHDVHFYHVYGTRSSIKGRTVFFDPEEVDAAIRAYLSLETMRHAASRLRICDYVMAKLLREDGWTIKPRVPTRLSPHVYDGLVHRWRASKSTRTQKTTESEMRLAA